VAPAAENLIGRHKIGPSRGGQLHGLKLVDLINVRTFGFVQADSSFKEAVG
jgi:hypothetical protein